MTKKKAKQTMKIGIDLEKLNVSTDKAGKMQENYYSMNEYATTAVLNWYKVRNAELRALREDYDIQDQDIDTLDGLSVPDECNKNILLAIVDETAPADLGDKLQYLTPSAATVLIDLLQKGSVNLIR